ncbi:MAG: hypothetical protein RKH07_09370 [Gammaproteobacteria bacterium]
MKSVISSCCTPFNHRGGIVTRLAGYSFLFFLAKGLVWLGLFGLVALGVTPL